MSEIALLNGKARSEKRRKKAGTEGRKEGKDKAAVVRG